MSTLRIGALRARYRVPANDREVRARLDALLRETLEESLEPALERAGIDSREEVCIRSIEAPVRLGLHRPDSALRTVWGVSLAGSIREVIESAGPDVVRYATRTHALADLVSGVAAGDLRRAWAWRQLGLWPLGDAPGSAAASEAAVAALLAHPTGIVPAIAAAAADGHLPRLVARLPERVWAELTRAALRAAEAPEEVWWLEGAGGSDPGRPADAGYASAPGRGAPSARREQARPAESRGGPEPLENAKVQHPHLARTGRTAGEVEPGPAREAERVSLSSAGISPDARARAERVRSGSRIARAIGALGDSDLGRRQALSVLAVLEAEPQELRRPRQEVSDLLGRIARPRREDARAADLPLTSRSGTERQEGRADGRSARVGRAEAGGGRERELSSPAALAPDRPASSWARAHPDVQVLGSQAPTEAAEGERPLPAISPAQESAWGGLLFLLHLVRDLALAEEIAADPVFAARSLRWVLHRLAVLLLGGSDTDPAALAFAGLPPDAPPPSHDQPPADEAEAAALDELALRLRAALRSRMTESPAEADLHRILRRRARIEASPGWIDVVLGLDEVSIEVRRAGLDLDPGWLPWLGVVVRFVYE